MPVLVLAFGFDFPTAVAASLAAVIATSTTTGSAYVESVRQEEADHRNDDGENGAGTSDARTTLGDTSPAAVRGPSTKPCRVVRITIAATSTSLSSNSRPWPVLTRMSHDRRWRRAII